MPEISLLINDIAYKGWKSASIDVSIENLSGVFNLTVSDKWLGDTAATVIAPLDSCSILIDDDIVLTGYVEVVNLTIDASTHTIQIMGRDKAADLVDCSIINGTGQYLDLKIEEIIERISSLFEIPVTCKIDTGKPIPTFNVDQGSTALEAIQKLCYARQCLALSDGLGGIVIARAGSVKATTQIIEGLNMLSGSAQYDFSSRFSHYVVKGQQQGSDTIGADSSSSNSAMVEDVAVNRFRPIVLVADGQADKKDCETRAQWELNTRKARSRRFSITVAGWLQEDGDLWRTNQLVFLQSAALGAYDDLLIVGINYSMSEAGQITTLNLAPKDAYLTIETDLLDNVRNPFVQDEAADDEP